MSRRRISLLLAMMMVVTTLFSVFYAPTATVRAAASQGIIADIYGFDGYDDDGTPNMENLFADDEDMELNFTGEYITDSELGVVLTKPHRDQIKTHTDKGNPYNFGANMKAYLRIPKTGWYTFHFGLQGSNAVMTIDGEEVFRIYDRWNNMVRKQKSLYLTEGDHEWNVKWYAFRWVGDFEFKVNIDGEFDINDVPESWYYQTQENVPAATPATLPDPLGTPTPCPIIETDAPEEDVLYVYEGFDYDNGAINGLGKDDSEFNGGTAWRSKWEVHDENSSKPRALVGNESALVYSGLKSTQSYASTGEEGSRFGRRIDVQHVSLPDLRADWDNFGKADTAVWFSTLLQLNGTDDINVALHRNGIPWFVQEGPLEDRSVQFGTFGTNSLNDSGKKVWTLRVNDAYVKTDIPVKNGETAFIAAEIAFDSQNRGARIRMYVNPDVTKPLGEPSAEYRLWGRDFKFQSIGISLGSKKGNAKVDELRLGNTFRAVAPLSTFKLPVTKVEIWPVNGDVSTLAGATIMGSNDSATYGFETLYSVGANPTLTEGRVVLENPNVEDSYRYVKLYGATGSAAKVAEIKFYSGKTLLEGEPFATVAKEGTSAGNAFDDNVDTYYEGAQADDQYVGLDLGGETVVAVPVADPVPGRYEEPISVTLRSETNGADIYYTLDGSYPTKETAILYENPISLKQGDALILKAIAVKEGLITSSVFAGGYGIGTTAPVAKGLTTYHIGNSLTDTTNGMLERVAQSANQNHMYMRWTIPGASMPTLTTSKAGGFGYPWVDSTTCDVSDVQNDQYSERYDDGLYFDPDTCVYTVDRYAPIDYMVVQPFNNGDNEETYCELYGKPLYDKARESNPNISFLVYSSWGSLPKSTNDTDFDTWLANYTRMNEKIADDMNALYPDDPSVDVVPNALALKNLQKAIVDGQIPGVDDFTTWAAACEAVEGGIDTLHLSSNGAYLVNLTTYTVMYKQNPVNTVTYKPDGMTEEQATALKQIAWDTCCEYSYANVSVENLPTPTATATAKPSATATATATDEPSATATDEPSDGPTAGTDETPTATPGTDATPGVDATPGTSNAPSVSESPTATPSTTPSTSPTPVAKKVTKVKFVKRSVKVKKGKKVTLKVKLTPAKGLSKKAKNVKWSIDKKGKKVVKFVKKANKLNGKLTATLKAVKKGKAKVTCKAPSGKKAVCTITVK